MNRPPLIFGSHLSIAGGYYKAIIAAKELGFAAVQIFTKNNNQWVGKPISPADIDRFRDAWQQTGLQQVISHNSYLINLAAIDDALLEKSRRAMVDELIRAHALGIPHVVAHPGAHMGAGESAGIAKVANSLDWVFSQTQSLPTTVALEVTAGQGTCLGHRFEHLAEIIGQSRFPDRLTVCLDTCHLFAAGYPLSPRRKYLQTMRELDSSIGSQKVIAIHVNDSKKPLGSRVDRHEHIGIGELGDEPFENLLRDKRFRAVPFILETPKETNPQANEPWDSTNLARLKRLAGTARK